MTPGRLGWSLILAASSVSACADFDEGAARARVHEVTKLPAELPKLKSVPAAQSDHLGTWSARDFISASAPKRVTQKVLLVRPSYDAPSYLAAKDALARIGIPYLETSGGAIPELWRPESGVNICNFNSVLFAVGGSVTDSNERQRIVEFELACDAREAIWYTWPVPSEMGLTAISSTNAPFSATVDQTTVAKAFFSRVKPTAQLSVHDAFAYPSTPDASTTPLLRGAGGVVMAIHKTADGREQLVSTLDHSPYLHYSVLVEYDMLRWLTRGMFVGKKRTYFMAQVDDIFINNFMWDPVNNETPQIDGVSRTFRISADDMTEFVSWQSAFKATLPAGSTFLTEMAFNGLGVTSTTDPLVVASRNAGTKLTWMNHTWTHENMDGMTRAEAKAEVQRNCTLGRNLLLNAFSCVDLVTPEISGLTNPGAVLGMLDAGVRWVVSDTSRTEALYPLAPGDNPSFNVGRPNRIDARLYQVPRHPTTVYYNVDTPEVHADEYASMYADYWASRGNPTIDYAFVQDKGSDFAFAYMLQGNIDPLMFHQANLANYARPNAYRSLYSDYVEATFGKYLAVSSAPILTLSQVQIGQAMIERDKLNKCGLTATIIVSALGTRSLELRAANGCTIPVTGINKSLYGKVEAYGTERTTNVTLAPGGVVTIPL